MLRISQAPCAACDTEHDALPDVIQDTAGVGHTPGPGVPFAPPPSPPAATLDTQTHCVSLCRSTGGICTVH